MGLGIITWSFWIRHWGFVGQVTPRLTNLQDPPQDAHQDLRMTGNYERILCTLKAKRRTNYRSSSHALDKNQLFLRSRHVRLGLGWPSGSDDPEVLVSVSHLHPPQLAFQVILLLRSKTALILVMRSNLMELVNHRCITLNYRHGFQEWLRHSWLCLGVKEHLDNPSKSVPAHIASSRDRHIEVIGSAVWTAAEKVLPEAATCLGLEYWPPLCCFPERE